MRFPSVVRTDLGRLRVARQLLDRYEETWHRRGPPTYPATVAAHSLARGGRVDYYMRGPEGDKPRGY